MIAEEEKLAADAAPPKMQFSLRTLLLLPVAVACALAALFTKPPSVAVVELLLIAFLLPAALTATIVYGKGYTRAFCIGALFPAGALFLFSVMEFYGVLSSIFVMPGMDLNVLRQLQCSFDGAWLAAVLCGCLCVGLRWLLQRPAAGDGSARRHSSGRAIFLLLLILLVLSGPIIGRIGISAGWWGPGAPVPVATMTPYAALPYPPATTPSTSFPATGTSPPSYSVPYPPGAPIEPAGTR